MSGVFQNIDPPTRSPPGECVLPAFGAGVGYTRWVESSEDARHYSVLFICKYFEDTQYSVPVSILFALGSPPVGTDRESVFLPKIDFTPTKK
jgi:hypothetical protein